MQLEPTVLHEDDSVLVVAKPAGWVVNRSDSVSAPTMQDWVEKYFAGNEQWEEGLAADPIFSERSGLAHRIDRETSGVLLIGKTPEIMNQLLAQFKNRQVKKTYQALVHGYMPAKAGIVNAPIARDKDFRTRFTVEEGGREASTLFRVITEYKTFVWESIRETWVEEIADKPLQKKLDIYQGFSLIHLEPHTGRTHQIRVHMKFLRTPIVGDRRYNTPKRSYLDANWCPRQFLHAAKLTFIHPVTQEEMTIEAPLPEDLVQVLSLLELR